MGCRDSGDFPHISVPMSLSGGRPVPPFAMNLIIAGGEGKIIAAEDRHILDKLLILKR